MATIEANLERTGTGKVVLNGQDISGITCGISIQNSVHKGNTVVIGLPSPSVIIKVDSDHIYLQVGETRYRLIEE